MRCSLRTYCPNKNFRLFIIYFLNNEDQKVMNTLGLIYNLLVIKFIVNIKRLVQLRRTRDLRVRTIYLLCCGFL